MSELSQRLASLSPAKRRLLEQRLQRSTDVGEPIAIVGMGCRFPGARNPDEFWQVISEARTATGEIPPSRWDADEFYDPTGEISGKMSSRWGGFVDDVDLFDPMFFGIAPREAKAMDPQQRLLLEVSWEALERGGLAPDRMAGSATGVFVGIGGSDYSKIPTQYADYYEHIDPHVGTGNALSIAANRISYILDLHGPSIAVDTACSSALVCIHLAVQSLRRRECDAALAGGVNLILTPETMIAFSKARMLSPDGLCRPFDAGANGYVRGEGCGMVVLKRLTDALRERDAVLAVIRGTAVNQDGRTSGITAPNSVLQRAAILAALGDAGLLPGRVNYIEAHGTGTPLGDPIEVQALSQIFVKTVPSDPPCHMTSVKANIGHTETVSGVAGLIKVILMMQHGQIPPQAHLQKLNPNMSLEGSRLVIPTEPVAWLPQGGPRIAGVSSFGFGGTNAHIVVEEAGPVETPAVERDRPLHILALSAKTETAVKTLAGEYAARLADPGTAEDDGAGGTPAPQDIADVCFSANAGRAHFNQRLTVVGQSRQQIAERLQAFSRGQTAPGTKAGRVRVTLRPKIAMLFTGQGSQHVGMGRTLFDTQPVFRQVLEECDALLRDQLEEPLLSVLYPEPGRESPLDNTAYTQPALFSIEYALAMLWRSWGIEPDVVLGHSVGEYVAACVAGVFSLEDGLRLIAGRARLMQELPAGGMMAAVFAGPDRVGEAIAPYQDRVSIAAANGPENTVISGEAEAIGRILADLAAAGVRAQQLVVSHAFHSPLMEPMLDEFQRLAATVACQRPRMPIVSNLTGGLLQEEPPDAKYWRSHVRNAVQFATGMKILAEQDLHAMLEVGPAPVLLGMGRRCIPQSKALWLPSLRKGQDDWQMMLGSLSDLYLLGVKVDWAAFERPWPRRRLSLPTYPFERTRLWFDGGKGPRGRATVRGPALHPLLGSRVTSALETTLFEVRLSSSSPKYLVDHQVQGSPVVPAAAYIEQGLAAAQQAFGPGRHSLENVSIQHAMFLPPGTARTVQVTFSPERGGECAFETYSTPADSDKPHWTMHACGTLKHGDAVGRIDNPSDSAECQQRVIDLDEVRSRVVASTDHEEFYRRIALAGLAYGPTFQMLDDLQRADRDALATIRLLPETVRELPQYHLHPIILDACMQAMAGIVPMEADGSHSLQTYMPTGVRRLVIHGDLTERMYVYAARAASEPQTGLETVEGDVYLLDESGRVLVELSGVRVQRLGRTSREGRPIDVRQWLYRIAWESAPPVAQASSLVSEQPTGGTGGSSASGTAARPAPTWLVFADRQGVGQSLADSLRQQGDRCVLVRPRAVGQVANPVGQVANLPQSGQIGNLPHAYEIDPLAPADYERLLSEVLADGQPTCAGVIHLWALDVPDADRSPAESLDQARRLGCGSVLQLVKQLARSKVSKPPALWLATRGAQPIRGDEDVASPAQSTLWGMGRVAAMEHPEQHCRLVDLDPAAAVEQAARVLASELTAASEENQIAYRDGRRFVARLQPAADALPATGEAGAGGPLTVPREGAFRLRLGTPGSFDSLRFESFTRRRPGPGQMEFEVRAAGLNFSDVLKALGLYPGIKDEIVPLGIECSGIVTALGEGVERFKVGDAVMGVAPYCFASHAITAEYAMVHKPQGIADDEAATIPITFLTAYYGLVHLAQMQPGERVLIHAGAGGVGLAAIQIAKHIGAEIFATAGSDQKRDFLCSLGVEHVMSSRTLDFADEIMKATDHQGVDIVLNSLPGDAITKSLASLRAYGRFLEIGKTDIYQNRMIGLLPFQDNLSYFAIDLDRMLRQRPEQIRGLFAEVVEHFRAGHFHPLALTLFGIEETVGAFRYMAQRKNIGKVVVSLESRPTGPEDETPAVGPVRAEASYLITGGLGALGLQVADWLASQGAKHLVLMGRKPPAGDTRKAIDALRRSGAEVAAVQGDVADRESLDAALRQIPGEFPPLAGVVHAAGVLDDGVMFNMDLAQLDRPMAPKVAGAWNLHEATRDRPLDFFVLFSSVACVLGSPGQANYAAGNAFLDGLAHWRRTRGLPATSIDWGPWAGSGMAADGDVSEQIAARGMAMIPADKGLEVLGGLLRSRPANLAVMDARWPDMRRAMRGRTSPLLAVVSTEEEGAAEEPKAAKVDRAFREKLLAVEMEQRKTLLRDYFAAELARIMGIDVATLDVEQPLNTIGLDSLMGIELKNNLESRLAIVLPMSVFMEGPTVTSLADCAAGLIVVGEAASAAEASAAAPGSTEAQAAAARSSGATPAGQLAAKAQQAAASSWNPLVTLKRKGAKAPLFCVHAAGGDVTCYFHMTTGLDDRPVHALRARGLEDGLGPHRSVRELAADFASVVRRVQPEGPYNLAGWSTGGIFAFALAEQLAAEGGSLGTLMLVNAPPPLILKNVDPDDDAQFLYDLANFSNRAMDAKMRLSLEELRSQDRETRLQMALDEAKRTGIVAANVTVDYLRRFVDLCRAHVAAIQAYSLTPLNRPIHFFRPAETGVLAEASGQQQMEAAGDLGWGAFTPRVIVHVSPGDHFGMLIGENGRSLGQVMARCLEGTCETDPAAGN